MIRSRPSPSSATAGTCSTIARRAPDRSSRTGPDLTRLAIAFGDLDRATATAAHVADVAEHARHQNDAHRSAALSHTWADAGRRVSARAPSQLGTLPERAIEHAVTCEEAGLRLRDAGQRKRGRTAARRSAHRLRTARCHCRHESRGRRAHVGRLAASFAQPQHDRRTGGRASPVASSQSSSSCARGSPTGRSRCSSRSHGVPSRRTSPMSSPSSAFTSRVELATAATAEIRRDHDAGPSEAARMLAQAGADPHCAAKKELPCLQHSVSPLASAHDGSPSW